MSVSTQAAAPPRLRFNPFDPAFRADPYPTYQRLRTEAPFFRTLDTVVLTRYEDVLEALRSRSFSAELIPQAITRHAAKLGIGGIEQTERFIRKSIVFTDNPEHNRLRRLVNQAFSTAAVQDLKPLIAVEVARLVDRVAPTGAMDVMQDLAEKLPLNVLCEWMGVPETDRSLIGEHIHSVRFLLDPGLMTRTEFAKVLTAMGDLTAYFGGLLAAGAAEREGTLIARLAAARNDGDRLSDEEVVFACIMSFVAGNETTQCLIGNTLDALLKHPDQLALVRDDRGLITATVEETLRYQTPLQLTKRLAGGDVTIGGNLIRRGEQVLLCLAAANRDPSRFPEPDRFDIRRDGPAHVGFGYGMHTCLGGLLARLQAEVVLASLLDRFAAISRADDREIWQTHSLILRGLDRLPIRFELN